jgi:hypothetical protein
VGPLPEALLIQVSRGKIVARFRKTAVAAVALSALTLTPTAAYAHDQHGIAGSSEDSGMTWGHYSGDVTDFTTNPPETTTPPVPNPDLFEGAKASAIMIGLDGRSFFRLRVTGIDAKDGTYGVHLHEKTCEAGDFNAAGPHYNVAWYPLPAPIPLDKVNNQNEVWLDLNVDSHGDARSTATVSFIPEGKRSIVLHAQGTKGDGTAGPRLACIPFDIKVFGK